VDCRDYQELVSAAVDNHLGKDDMDSLLEHIGLCPACRLEYEIESITKSFIRGRVKLIRTPSDLVERIGDQLRQAGTPAARTTSLFRLLGVPFAKPAIAFGVACLAVVILVTFSDLGTGPVGVASVAANDVIRQSFDNYVAVVNGNITPQIVSDKPEVLKDFLAGKTDFQVMVPTIKDCNLVGVTLNEYEGSNLVHVVYSHAGEFLYLYQACWETVMKGEKLSLAPEAKDRLQRTGWFVDSRPDGCTIVLWIRGRTLCAAVARMDKSDLIASLEAEEIPGRGAW
jgi:hypothetical protein